MFAQDDTEDLSVARDREFVLEVSNRLLAKISQHYEQEDTAYALTLVGVALISAAATLQTDTERDDFLQRCSKAVLTVPAVELATVEIKSTSQQAS